VNLELEGKTAYITGAAHGIGAAITDALVSEGVHVVVSDIDGEGLAARAPDWGQPGRPAVAITADLSTAEGAEHAARRACQENGGSVDILVNNVGVAQAREFEDIDDAAWQKTFELNFFSYVRTSRVVIPEMARRSGGCVVNVASDLAKQPEAIPADYGATKAAIHSLTKSLAFAYAAKGVRVNCVCPGPIWTSLWTRPGGVVDNLLEVYGTTSKDEAIARYVGERRIPLGIGQPEDVAAIVLILASPRAKHVTGSAYNVDGGAIRSLM